MKMLLAAFALAAAAATPALAQETMPTCSATVKDKCMQPAKAEMMAANDYKGGGKDNSAMMGMAKKPMKKMAKPAKKG